VSETTQTAGCHARRTRIVIFGNGFGAVYTASYLDKLCRRAPSLVLTKFGDYLQLARPRLALLVLTSVGAGWLCAAGAEPNWSSLVRTLIDTVLLFGGASALNQLLERRSDALMPRTANRSLAAGKLQAWEVLVLGCTLSAGGLVDLLAARKLLAAGLGAFALVSYLLVYTPLKRRTTLNTLIGAIPGAVPPLMGWAAARGRLDTGALALFLIVFLWQVPHFLAIAWIYRDEYARAGLRVLPAFDPDGIRTGREMIRYILVLMLASQMPFALGKVGWIAGLGALVLGMLFLYRALVFADTPTAQQARQVFRTSLLFLPALFLLFVMDAPLLNGW
jgi:protoheme IX farnesyltransferase